MSPAGPGPIFCRTDYYCRGGWRWSPVSPGQTVLAGGQQALLHGGGVPAAVWNGQWAAVQHSQRTGVHSGQRTGVQHRSALASGPFPLSLCFGLSHWGLLLILCYWEFAIGPLPLSLYISHCCYCWSFAIETLPLSFYHLNIAFKSALDLNTACPFFFSYTP